MRRGLLVGVCAALAAAFIAPGALGATLRVWNGTGGGACVFTYVTIQDAVDAAALTAAADTIIVCQGTYNENVVVNTDNVTIQAKTQAPDVLSCTGTRTNLATVVNMKKFTIVEGGPGGSAAFDLQGNKITLKGFVLQNTTNAAAVSTSPSFSQYLIQLNLFQDNTIGLNFNSSGAALSTAVSNCFRENNEAGASAGTAIYSDQGLNTAGIQGNRFYNNENAAVLLTHCDTVNSPPASCFVDTPRPTAVSVNGNLMLNKPANGPQPGSAESYTFATIVHSIGSGLNGNILKGGTWNGSAIFVGPGNDGLKIKGNIIQKSTGAGAASWYRGIHIKADEDNFGTFGTSTALDISGNIIQGMQLDGLRVGPTSMTMSMVKSNIVQKNGFDEVLEPGDGIKVNSDSYCFINIFCNFVSNDNLPTSDNFGNTFSGNIATGNKGHDCHDATNGAGTGGTANTWQGTIGKLVNRTGICFPGLTVVPDFDHDPYP